MYTDTSRKGHIMSENKELKSERPESLIRLRKQIYLLESSNIHKKNPLKDDEMIKRIIAEIKRFVDMEGN